MADVKTWIIDWFAKNTAIDVHEIEAALDQNYFERGWIDSLKFVSFVMELEEAFGISFENHEFQNRSFATIDGLSEIIKEKLSK